MTLAKPDAILATGGIASDLQGRRGLLEVLAAAGERQLIADAGGFHADTGFYRTGRGRVEDEVLATLYDVLLPAGHGFTHYAGPRIAALCVCTNLSRNGQSAFRPSTAVRVGGTETLILGVLGRRAFTAIPAGDRREITWVPPADAVRAHLARLGRRSSQAALVLSYCDPWETGAVAAACPGGLDAIVSALPAAGARITGEATVACAHGADHGQGLRLEAARWKAERFAFPTAVRGPGFARLRALHTEVQKTADRAARARPARRAP